jgi:hypothetical protein
MQPEPGQIHVPDLGHLVEPRENPLDPVRRIRSLETGSWM